MTNCLTSLFANRKSTYLIAANCESLNKRQNFGSPNDNAKVFPSSEEWAPIASTVSGHTEMTMFRSWVRSLPIAFFYFKI